MEKKPIIHDTRGDMVYDGDDISTFQGWLKTHMYISTYHRMNVEKVMRILDLADTIHSKQIRKDGTKYINHIVRVILDGDHNIKDASLLFMPRKIMIRAVHDVIEDHPAMWKRLYDEVGIEIFRDALVLATGGISLQHRAEMLSFFDEITTEDLDVEYFDDINRILSPINPFAKLEFSHYSAREKMQGKKRMYNAIALYHQGIIKKESRGEDKKDQDMYIALGNYIYFTRENARDKVADMCDNMSDMAEREQQKPGYTQKRRIKAYILGVKLREYSMKDEYRRLEDAFVFAGSSMLSDEEVEAMFRQIRGDVPLPWEV